MQLLRNDRQAATTLPRYSTRLERGASVGKEGRALAAAPTADCRLLINMAAQADDAFLGWLCVLVAIVCFGSFAAPVKTKRVKEANVHPLVYQTYKSFWCFATCFLVLLIPSVREGFRFMANGDSDGDDRANDDDANWFG